MDIRETLKNKSRIIIKIGSSSLTHPQTGALDLTKLEILIREICNIKNMGKDVILVSSGAIAVGSRSAGFQRKPKKLEEKQACAAIGQAQLMMIYQKLFAEYGHMAAQVLMTKNTITNDESRRNAYNTFQELLKLDAIPIVNENDTVSTYEMQFGDNDSLSAIVASLVGADLLILLSDIDGLYTDDPRKNPKAELIPVVEKIDNRIENMAGDTVGSDVGTGGMTTKLTAARIATLSGADMIIANAKDVGVLHQIFEGKSVGTFFKANKNDDFYIADYVEESMG